MSVTETYILVPHLLRYVPCFARYLQIPYIPSYPHIYLHDRDRIVIDCSTTASHPWRSVSVWTRDRMHGMIQTEALPFIILCFA